METEAHTVLRDECYAREDLRRDPAHILGSKTPQKDRERQHQLDLSELAAEAEAFARTER